MGENFLRNHPGLEKFVLSNVKSTGTIIGSGAYGKVEEVVISGTICAAKTLHTFLQRTATSNAQLPKSATRFVTECELMSTLGHSNIVQFMGFAFFPGSQLPALVMERLLTSLHDLLDPDSPYPGGSPSPLSFFSTALKCSVLHNVASGLEYLHGRSPPVIHRDLSAKNVLLDTQMVAKISDLGVARILPLMNVASMMTNGPGAFIYMPPEVFGETAVYDASIDIFSLGVVTIFTMGEEFPRNLLKHNYFDEESEVLLGRTELQRRSKYMECVKKKLHACGQLHGNGDHPLIRLIEQCLHNIPAKRPGIPKVLCVLEEAKFNARAGVDDEEGNKNKRDLVQALLTRPRNQELQVISDERAQQLTSQAMESGSLKQRNVVGVITGMMGSGKTTLLCHLFGIAPPDIYTSTGIAAQSIRGFLHHIVLNLSANAWKQFSYDIIFQSQSGNTTTTTTTDQIASSIASDMILELVHMIDTGGQPELMEVMPSLVQNANLAIVLTDLRYGLNEHCEVDYHEEGVRYKRQFSSHYTSRDIILKLASTLHANKPLSEAFHLIIIATHRDCVESNLEARIKELNNELNLLLPAFKNQLILSEPPDKVAFVLDLKNPDTNDKEAIGLIRSKISKSGIGTTFDTPTSFFLFEQKLLKFATNDVKRFILSLKECKEVGAKLKLSGEMVEAALILFHQQNTFLYFRHILPNHIFIKPQIPLDIVNAIVRFSYKVSTGELKGFPAKFVTKLKECIVTEEMLSCDDQISPHFKKDVYEVKDALKLFCHTFTLAPLDAEEQESPVDDKNREYLMMSLKPPIPKQELNNYIPKSSDTTPLVVNFSSGCVPLGCFSSTISCLISKNGWEVIRIRGSPKCLAYNIASLRDPDLVVDIVLVDFTQHLEIHISTSIGKRSSPANICNQICRKIFGAIQKVFKTMLLDKDQIKVSPAVICNCNSALNKHDATFKKQFLVCSEDSTIFDPDPKQSMWRSDDTNLKPDLSKLLDLDVPKRVGAQYEPFGIRLLNDEKGNQVETIKKDCHHESEAIVLKILRKWLRAQPTPVTWKNFFDILKKCDLTTLAEDVCKTYNLTQNN